MTRIWLGNWIVTAMQEHDDLLEVAAEFTVEPDACPKCLTVGPLYRHGSKTLAYRDVPTPEKKVLVHAKVLRFRCHACGATSMQPLRDMDPRRRLTRRCVAYVEEQGASRAYSQIATDIGIDEKTVREICNERFTRELKDYKPTAPNVLGIDDLAQGRQRRVLLTDVGERKTIDVLQSRSRSEVERGLDGLLDKDKTEIVAMDTINVFRESVRSILPKAIIVVDKQHVQSKAGEALERVRIGTSKTIASKDKPQRPGHSDGSPPKQTIPEDPQIEHSQLTAAIRTKDEFDEVWEAPNRQVAEQLYEVWKGRLPFSVALEFGSVAKIVDEWHHEIFASFEFPIANFLPDSSKELVEIFILIVPRPEQLASLKVRDLWKSEQYLAPAGFVLNVPRIKQQGTISRAG